MREHLVFGFIDDARAQSWDVFDGRGNDGTDAKFVLTAVVPAELSQAELLELAVDYFREDITSDYDCTGQWFSRGVGVVMGSPYISAYATAADGSRSDEVREIFVSVNYGRDI